MQQHDLFNSSESGRPDGGAGSGNPSGSGAGNPAGSDAAAGRPAGGISGFEQLPGRLGSFLQLGGFSDIDRQFPRFLHRRFGESDEAVLAAATLLVAAVRQGHTALDPTRPDPGNLLTEQGRQLLDTYTGWPERFRRSRLTGDGSGNHPLVFDRGLLYLHRYWHYETGLAGMLKQRAGQTGYAYSPDQLKQTLDPLFPDDDEGTREQKNACLTALTRRFSVITGGPGTGKTYTVLRLMALLLILESRDLRMVLAAPTGKAAARVKESITRDIEQLPIEDPVRRQIPDQAHTLHRLLGTIPKSARYRHNSEHTLPYDVVILDEASMVDLALMHKLVDALPPHARLVLIGDKDQLASVEAGAVLGDICSHERPNRIGPQLAGLRKAAGLAENAGADLDTDGTLQEAVAELTVSRRFRRQQGIGLLAGAVNRGEAGRAAELLDDAQYGDLQWLKTGRRSQWQELIEGMIRHFQQLPELDNRPEQAFTLLHGRQLLCGHRRGPFGSEQINRQMEARLRPESGRFARAEWYPGRPVIVTRNDYQLNLYNGEVGITLWDPQREHLYVWFEKPGAEAGTGEIPGFKRYNPGQLSHCEPAYALSVHKAQGSEFDEVVLVLPNQLSPVLTQELIYTALTRARRSLTLWGRPDGLQSAITRKVQRSSGLAGRLQEGDTPG